MKRTGDLHLLGEVVMVDNKIEADNQKRQLGKVIIVTPGNNVVHIQFADGSLGAHKKEELLHLYPRAVILQGLISNFEMSPENFKTILLVTRLISEKRNAEALKLAVSNDLVKFFCTTDSKSWLEMQKEARGKQHTKKKR